MNDNTLSSALDSIPTLDYEDEKLVIEGFMERYDVDYEEAADIFEETKKWLWLASKGAKRGDISIFIDRQLLVIDEMWHNFILHTKQYYRFCLENFNLIIHHIPTSREAKLRAQQERDINPEKALMKEREKIGEQLSFIYDNLGEETLLKWYQHLAEKYTPEYLETLRKT